jgi:hypothetical protein
VDQRRRDLLLLFVLGLLLHGTIAAMTSSPGYFDAYYYYNGGVFIAKGQWTEPYIWNYVSAPSSLPVPAFAYWQPFPSMLAALGIKLFPGLASYDAAQIPFVLLAAILPLISYTVGLNIGERRHALTGALLTIFSGLYAPFWSVVETFTPFAVAGAGALALAGAARTKNRWWLWGLAGICAAIAHLTRADGILLVAVLIAVAMFLRTGRSLTARGLDCLLILVGYVAIMAPWWARNLSVFGGIQASGGLSTLWLLEYDEMFNYPAQLTAARYFNGGWGLIVQSKLEALRTNLERFVGELNIVFLAPFSIISLLRRWRHDWLLPAVLYGLALFAAMTFAFTWPGANGGWFHSSGALIPFMMPAAALGVDDAVNWIARRRRSWRPAQARGVFGAATVMIAVLLTAYIVVNRVVGLPFSGQFVWNNADTVYRELGDVLDAMDVPRNAPVMVADPPGFYTHTGHGGIPLPNGDEETLLRAADEYGVEYVVVDVNVGRPLKSLYKNGPQSARLVEIAKIGDTTLYRIESVSE